MHLPGRKISCIVLVILSLDQAQDSTETRINKLRLSEFLKTEITGSTLYPEIFTTVPAATTVFTYETIQPLGFKSLDELMNVVPGFQSYRSSNSSLHYPYSSRGRRADFYSSEILLIVDGQRIYDPRTSGSSMVVSKFPLHIIERVEFIRGPGAALYGSNAMTGVINIITRSESEVNLSYGNLHRRLLNFLFTITVEANKILKEFQIDIYGKIDLDNGEDYKLYDNFSGEGLKTDDAQFSNNLILKVRWHKTHASLNYNEYKTNSFYINSSITNSNDSVIARLNTMSLKQNLDWKRYKTWAKVCNRISQFNVISQITESGSLSAISNPPSDEGLILGTNYRNYSETCIQWHNQILLNSNNNFQFGFEYRHKDSPESTARSNYNYEDYINNNPTIRFFDQIKWTIPIQAGSQHYVVGFYSQYQLHLLSNTHLTLGLRYDDYSKFGSQFLPRLALVQNLDKHNILKILYGEAVRIPSETELHSQNLPFLLGNPNLKPEFIKSWEVIWMGQWANSSNSISYFENRFSKSIVLTDDGSGIPQYNNISQNTTRGIEAEAYYELFKYFLFRFSYTFLFQTPETSYRETNQFASLMLTFHYGKFNTNITGTYFDEREMYYGNNKIILDAYEQIFLKMNYRINSDWNVFVQSSNIFDEYYRTPASTTSLSWGVPNRGRQFLIGVTWKFFKPPEY